MDGVAEFVFDVKFYVSRYADIASCVRGGNFDPEQHFYEFGLQEGRLPSFFFDIDYVQLRLRKLLGLDIERKETIARYRELPAELRFVPNRWFNPWSFRLRYEAEVPEVRALNDCEAFDFYFRNAGQLHLSPSGLFDEEGYIARYPDVIPLLESGEYRSGFHHFATAGWQQGRANLFDFGRGIIEAERLGSAECEYLIAPPTDLRKIVWWFDEEFYLGVHPDIHALVRQGKVKCGLEHFLLIGFAEGRVPHPGLFGMLSGPRAPNSLTNFFAALRDRQANRPPATIPLGEAAALARYIEERRWNTDRAAVADTIWSFVAPPRIEGICDEPLYLAANPDVQVALQRGEIKSARAHWLSSGIREQRLAPGSNVFAYRRLSLENLFRAQAGVNFIGPLSLASGLGAAARGYVAALRSAGIDVDTYDVSGLVQPGATVALFDPAALRFSINLILLNPDQVLPLVARFGTDLFDRRANVGMWVWELPTPRPEWLSILSGFDMIVAPSEYCRSAFATATGRPVCHLPYVVDAAALQQAVAQYRGNPAIDRLIGEKTAGRKIALFIMDASSFTGRKGADVFVRLAQRFEAAHPGKYLFCLKTHSRDFARSADLLPGEDAPVTIIDEVLDFPDLCKLKAIADAYVSPHRSEGFGLNIFESLMLGVPAFCSKYAGGIGLLPDDYPYFLPGGLSEVGRDLGPYRSHAVWFDPDEDALFAKLEEFLQSDDVGRKRFETITRDLARDLAPQAIGSRFRDLLREHFGLGIDLSHVVSTVLTPRDEFLRLGPGPAKQNAGEHVRERMLACINPVFSVITPTYNTDPVWLHELYEDLCAQTFTSWEWCIHDDGSTDPRTLAALAELRRADARIRIRIGRANQGISEATNGAVEVSCGRYLVIIDHDDRISHDLLRSYHAELTDYPDAALLYCDEDKLLPDGSLGDHFLKPDWSPEHAMSSMYVLHCLCVRKSLFLELGGYRREYDGAQDHDFLLRIAARRLPIRHVDKVLYHWRVTGGSTARSSGAKDYANESGRRAVSDHVRALSLDARVEHGLVPGTYRVRPRLPETPVSLNILTGCTSGRFGDRRKIYVEHFIHSILSYDYGIDYEIRVIADAECMEQAEPLAKLDDRVKVCRYDRGPGPFNFARKANFAVRTAQADRIVLLNDDMEAMDSDWLSAILEPLELPGVGVVGGRLLYPDDTVQHCGIVLGVLGAAAHIYVGAPQEQIGYNAFTHVIRNYSAVTGALMAFRKSLFTRVRGFDERYPIDFNDTDFCLRVGDAGYRIVYTPFARLRHFESRSAPRVAADGLDAQRFRRRWERQIERDPYFNAGLRRDSTIYQALAYD